MEFEHAKKKRNLTLYILVLVIFLISAYAIAEEVILNSKKGTIDIAPQQLNGWIIQKTNAEINLDVNVTILNETTSKIELGYIDKDKYYAELKTYLEKTNIDEKTGKPIKITDAELKLMISKFPIEEKNSLATTLKEIDMDNLLEAEKLSIEFSYSDPKDVSLKLGFGTIYVISNLSTSAVLNNVSCEGGGQYCHLSLNETLRLYYPFDVNTSTAYDWTSWNNSGTISGAFWNNSGKYGGTYIFDGVDDYIGLGNTPVSLRQIQTINFSISVWINPRTSGEGGLGVIYDNYAADSGGINFLIRNLSGGTVNGMQISIDFLTTDALTITNNNAVSYNTWQHFVLVFNVNTKNATFYKNGVFQLLATNTLGAGAVGVDSDNDLRIGNIRAGTTRTFNGSIDELMIFSKALNTSEITQIYNEQYPRFSRSGTHDLNQSIVTSDRINVTISNFNQQNSTADYTNISLKLSYDTGVTAEQNMTQTRIFVITDTTTYLGLNFTYIPDSYRFWSPVLNSSITIVNWSAGDILQPGVTITAPTQNQLITTSYVNFELTTNENASCFLSLNNFVINYTMSTSDNRDFNYTNWSIADGSYIANFSCNDTSPNNNINNSAWVNFTKDLSPNITFVSPTQASGVTINVNSTTINVTTGENVTSCTLYFEKVPAEYNITIDSTNHTDYGFSYPITYRFIIPQNSSGLKAFKRYRTTDSWEQLTENTSTQVFNGIETVRFNYTAGFAYLSVAFNSTSDSIFVKVTDSSNESVGIFNKTMRYYDDRKAVVTMTSDDWANWSDSNFSAISDMVRTRSMWLSVGIETNKTPNWTLIQEKVDAGFIEPVSHSRNHLAIPYDDDNEINQSKIDILANLSMPPLNIAGNTEYLYAYIYPFGQTDAGARNMLGVTKYLVARDISEMNQLAGWDSGNKIFTTGVSYLYDNDNNGNLVDANANFTEVYDAGGVYHLWGHPYAGMGTWLGDHLDFISGKTDVWYVAYGHLYLYHYGVNLSITSVDSSSKNSYSMQVNNEGSSTRANYTLINLNEVNYTYYVSCSDGVSSSFSEHRSLNINLTAAGPDTIYPLFYDYKDNNGSITPLIGGNFNVTVNNTNGSVYFWVNSTPFAASNNSANLFNVSVNFSAGGVYMYNWTAYGNGTSYNLNTSINRYFTVNSSKISINLAQLITSKDIISRMSGIIRKLVQSLTWNNLITKLNIFIKGMYQSITLDNIAARIKNVPRSIAQQINFNDLINKISYFKRSLINSLSLNDLASAFSEFKRNLVQSSNIRSLINSFKGFVKNIYQSINFDSTVSRLANIRIKLAQQLNLDSMANRFYSALVNIVQSIDVNNIAQRIQHLIIKVFQRIYSTIAGFAKWRYWIDVTYPFDGAPTEPGQGPGGYGVEGGGGGGGGLIQAEEEEELITCNFKSAKGIEGCIILALQEALNKWIIFILLLGVLVITTENYDVGISRFVTGKKRKDEKPKKGYHILLFILGILSLTIAVIAYIILNTYKNAIIFIMLFFAAILLSEYFGYGPTRILYPKKRGEENE